MQKKRGRGCFLSTCGVPVLHTLPCTNVGIFGLFTLHRQKIQEPQLCLYSVYYLHSADIMKLVKLTYYYCRAF